ncbi:hypothetical protein [Marinactinospora rubrisoli]|uniref:Uncharacterized protein n=1 Tax=Marinactinospora rubrisoli TaxID=2715399 RepID=A0ABW2KPC6_9ACTN
MPAGGSTTLVSANSGPDLDAAFAAPVSFEATQVKRGGGDRGGNNRDGNDNNNGNNRDNDGNGNNRDRDGFGVPGFGRGGNGFSAEFGLGNMLSSLMEIPKNIVDSAKGGVLGWVMESFQSSGSSLESGYGVQSAGPTAGRRSRR